MKFDDLLLHLGEFGRFQKRVYFLVCLTCLTHGMRMVALVFLLVTPLHRCSIPGYTNDSFDVTSIDHHVMLNMSIPSDDFCHVYTPGNYSYDSFNVPINASLVKCDHWVYDTSIFTETVASKFDLVCDNAIKRSHATMTFYGGFLIGVFILGTVSDLIGRKRCLFLSISLLLILGTALAFATNYIMFAILNFFVGASTTGIFSSAFVIGIELVGPSKRTYTGMFIQMYFSVGVVLLGGMAYLIRDWSQLELAITLPMALFYLLWCFIPESPRWQIQRYQYDQARKTIEKAQKENKTKVPEDIMDKVMPREKQNKSEENESKTIEIEMPLLVDPKWRIKTVTDKDGVIETCSERLLVSGDLEEGKDGSVTQDKSIENRTKNKETGTPVRDQSKCIDNTVSDDEVANETNREHLLELKGLEEEREKEKGNQDKSNNKEKGTNAFIINEWRIGVASEKDCVDETNGVKEKEKDEERGRLVDLFKSKVLAVRTSIIFLNWAVISLTFYALNFNVRNIETGSLFLNFFFVGLVEFPAHITVLLTVDRFGRKIVHCGMLVTSGIACLACVFSILYVSDDYQWVTVMLAMLGKYGAAGGFGTVYMYSTEIYPTVIRNSALGASSSWARVGAMLAPYVAAQGAKASGVWPGRGLPLLVCGILILVVGGLSTLLPETLNRKLPETITDAKNFTKKRHLQNGGAMKSKETNDLLEKTSTV